MQQEKKFYLTHTGKKKSAGGKLEEILKWVSGITGKISMNAIVVRIRAVAKVQDFRSITRYLNLIFENLGIQKKYTPGQIEKFSIENQWPRISLSQ